MTMARGILTLVLAWGTLSGCGGSRPSCDEVGRLHSDVVSRRADNADPVATEMVENRLRKARQDCRAKGIQPGTRG